MKEGAAKMFFFLWSNPDDIPSTYLKLQTTQLWYHHLVNPFQTCLWKVRSNLLLCFPALLPLYFHWWMSLSQAEWSSLSALLPCNTKFLESNLGIFVCVVLPVYVWVSPSNTTSSHSLYNELVFLQRSLSERQGYNLDRSPETNPHLKPTTLTCMVLDCGRKPENPEETRACKEKSSSWGMNPELPTCEVTVLTNGATSLIKYLSSQTKTYFFSDISVSL